MNNIFAIVLGVLFIITSSVNSLNDKKIKKLRNQFGQQIAKNEGINSMRLFEFYQKITKQDYNIDILYGFIFGFTFCISFTKGLSNQIYIVILLIILFVYIFYLIDFKKSKKQYENEIWFKEIDNKLINSIFAGRIYHLIIIIIIFTMFIRFIINN